MPLGTVRRTASFVSTSCWAAVSFSQKGRQPERSIYPFSLEKANVISNKKFTCYTGFEKEIPSGIYQDVLVCCDQNMITGRGPAAALEFAYTILEKLGQPSKDIREGMQYHYLVK